MINETGAKLGFFQPESLMHVLPGTDLPKHPLFAESHKCYRRRGRESGFPPFPEWKGLQGRGTVCPYPRLCMSWDQRIVVKRWGAGRNQQKTCMDSRSIWGFLLIPPPLAASHSVLEDSLMPRNNRNYTEGWELRVASRFLLKRLTC